MSMELLLPSQLHHKAPTSHTPAPDTHRRTVAKTIPVWLFAGCDPDAGERDFGALCGRSA